MLQNYFFVIFVVIVAVTQSNGGPISVYRNDTLGRLSDGQIAVPGQFPWTGRMQSVTNPCSCTLIRADWALTAGHCVDLDTLIGTVWFGSPYRSDEDEIARTFEAVVHPDYTGNNIFDIAMLRLSSPYQYSSTIQTIALPRDPNEMNEGDVAITTGFSWTGAMLFTDVLVLSRAECQEIRPPVFYICVTSDTTVMQTGNTGGALIVQDRGVWRLIGITGRVTCTSGVCSSVIQTPFHRISFHLGWIRSVENAAA